MSHVFISYSHKDYHCRDELIAKLKNAGFKDDDYWFDERDIEAGEEWRTAIDTALNEAFVVIIILTPEAVKSHFVTYEWSRAISDNLKVIPVVFKPLPKKLKHPLVERKQYLQWWNEGVQAKVIETISTYSELPPDTLYLNQLLLREILPFRIFSRISSWLYPYVKTKVVDPAVFNELLDHTLDLTGDLISKTLPDFMISKSYAFTSKQVRTCRQLIRSLEAYWDIFFAAASDKSGYFRYAISPEIMELAERQRLEEIETLVTIFENDGYLKSSYRKLDHYLSVISKGNVSPSGVIFYPPNEALFSAQYFILKDAIGSEELRNKLMGTIENVKMSKIRSNE